MVNQAKITDRARIEHLAGDPYEPDLDDCADCPPEQVDADDSLYDVADRARSFALAIETFTTMLAKELQRATTPDVRAGIRLTASALSGALRGPTDPSVATWAEAIDAVLVDSRIVPDTAEHLPGTELLDTPTKVPTVGGQMLEAQGFGPQPLACSECGMIEGHTRRCSGGARRIN